MKKTKLVGIILSTALILCSLISIKTYATVCNYEILTKQGEVKSYNVNKLNTSFLDYKSGQSSELFNSFKHDLEFGKFISVQDETGKHVSYEKILQAFLKTKEFTTPFNLDIFVKTSPSYDIKNTHNKKVDDLNKVITFKDEYLERSIRSEIHKPSGFIYKKDVQSITKLDISEGTVCMDGLENLTNLEEVSCILSGIHDLTPLRNLTSLTKLDFCESEIHDISPLKNLTQLRELNLARSNISDISALGNLTNLKILILGDNNISNLSPLKKLTNLQQLDLRYNPISDINPLSKLTKLKNLNLSNIPYIFEALGEGSLNTPVSFKARISNISALSNLTNLELLDLTKNTISDLTPLSNLKNLRYLSLAGNNVSNITALKYLKNLEDLNLVQNPIQNLDPIKNLNIENLILKY